MTIQEKARQAAADADYRYTFALTSDERARVDRAQYVGRAVAVAVLQEVLRLTDLDPVSHIDPVQVRALLAECAAPRGPEQTRRSKDIWRRRN